MTQTRMTKQRSVILDVLRSVTTHPTADEIYAMVREKLPRISLGTIYRNLDMLTATGEICTLEKTGSQKRFDGNTMPHYHVRCRECGKVGDLFLEIPLPSLENLHSDEFTVTAVNMEFVGVCAQCQCKH